MRIKNKSRAERRETTNNMKLKLISGLASPRLAHFFFLRKKTSLEFFKCFSLSLLEGFHQMTKKFLLLFYFYEAKQNTISIRVARLLSSFTFSDFCFSFR